jgi:hypothetical protein
MYYISIDSRDILDEQLETEGVSKSSLSECNKLVYYCRNCGHHENSSGNTITHSQNIFVTHTSFKKNEQEFRHTINQYTKLDPTLPRVNNVLCPNDECLTNTDINHPKEILIIRYDDKNMKYISMCSTCDTIWKPQENK